MRIKTALITLVLFLILTACHHADVDEKKVIPSVTDIVTATQSPVPTEAVTPSATETPTPTPTEIIAPEPTSVNEPTAIEPTKSEPDMTDIPSEAENNTMPTQVPYEGYVIGKDVNNNELKMTPQEADEFVMAGNILKLYDGSWFDIDDDGEPEYVSIQPYGHWEWNGYDYCFVVDGTKREFRKNPLYIISISAFNELYLYDTKCGFYYNADNERQYIYDNCVYITSMDGQSKQLIIRTTVFHNEWTENYPYVYRIEEKCFIGCGCLGCEIKEFELKPDKTYKASIDVSDTALQRYTLDATNKFDGKKIVTKIGEKVTAYIYKDPLVILADYIEFFSEESGEKDYVSLSAGDKVSFCDIKLLSLGKLEEIWNSRYLTDQCGGWYIDGYAKNYEISAKEAETIFLLHFFDVENGRNLWAEEKSGRLYSEKSGNNPEWNYFEWYIVGE